jgi:hypothetical protein
VGISIGVGDVGIDQPAPAPRSGAPARRSSGRTTNVDQCIAVANETHATEDALCKGRFKLALDDCERRYGGDEAKLAACVARATRTKDNCVRAAQLRRDRAIARCRRAVK